MMLKDIVLVVLCTDTQKIRKFYLTDKEEISEKKSTDRFMNNVFIRFIMNYHCLFLFPTSFTKNP